MRPSYVFAVIALGGSQPLLLLRLAPPWLTIWCRTSEPTPYRVCNATELHCLVFLSGYLRWQFRSMGYKSNFAPRSTWSSHVESPSASVSFKPQTCGVNKPDAVALSQMQPTPRTDVGAVVKIGFRPTCHRGAASAVGRDLGAAMLDGLDDYRVPCSAFQGGVGCLRPTQDGFTPDTWRQIYK
jgi:hypothetical protein